MASLETLIGFYRAVHRIADSQPLSQAVTAFLRAMASDIEATRAGAPAPTPGSTPWDLAGASSAIIETVHQTTSVAVMTYGFMGAVLERPGLDYLVSTGENSLTSDYYKGFNAQNRYINFMVNLATKSEYGNKFSSKYKDIDTRSMLPGVYTEIFGGQKPAAELVQLLEAAVPNGSGGFYTRLDYFAAIGGDGVNGVATKAALIGWLLSEAVANSTGPFYSAHVAYLRDVATGGDYLVHSGSNFLRDFGPGGPEALGGRNDSGLPGETHVFQPNWDVATKKPSTNSEIHALATDGNDLLTSSTGLDAGRSVFAGAGNDRIGFSAPMNGHVDGGSGNDIISFSSLNGTVATGAGYDILLFSGYAPVGFITDDLNTKAVVTDFAVGVDKLTIHSGGGAQAQQPFIMKPTGATLKDALFQVATVTESGKITVVEWNGDSYLFYQNLTPGLDQGDGLVKLAGATGLRIGGSGVDGDIFFD